MNIAIHAGTQASMTMSSREIAELTGKRHADVKRDIRNMLDALLRDVSSFARIYKDSAGRDQEEYALDRELTLTLVSGYDIPLRHRVVTRLAELESTANPANLSRMQLIELALQAEQERIALENKVNVLAPKAEALDRIAEADGAMNPTIAAKTLQIPPGRLFSWLRENQWIYRRPGSFGNVAYQDKIKAGYLTHKITTVHREDGSEKVVEQVLVTGKGLTKLAQVLGMQ